jgi:ATP-dependent DNA helicase RecQ
MAQPSEIKQVLNNVFQFDQFREGQEQTISQLLNGHSSLAVFPTGSGKSLCYQLPALLLPQLTLVVSPLLALMKDQVDFLNSKGIAAASLESSLDKATYFSVIDRVKRGEIKILMVSVERFKNERFRQFIQSVPISLLVVDEAHCISQWGHNFRPDYLKLPQIKQQLNIPTVLLLTATATKKVKLDMAHKFAISAEHIVQTGFYRANLDLTVLPTIRGQKEQQLLTLIRQQKGCGIIYVTLQKTAEDIAQNLQQQGVNAVAYHAGINAELKVNIQHQFMQSNDQVVVATIAFGMGIDKSNIRFVIHYDLPKSIENYSQEIGRAGRDGELSNCTVLGDLDDITTLENFVYGDTPEEANIDLFINQLTANKQGDLWHCQSYKLSQQTNIRQLTLKTLLVQCELMGLLRAKYSYFAEYRYYFIATNNEILAKFDAQRQLFLEQLFAATSFKKKWGTIDINHYCSQSDTPRERVIAALEYLHQQGDIELQSTQLTDVYQVSEDLLTKSNIKQDLLDYFMQSESDEITRMKRLLRFFELDSCLSYNLACYFDDWQAPKQCGHCSVCRGIVAKLSTISGNQVLDSDALASYLKSLQRALNETGFELTETLAAKFLTGLTQPVFTKIRATKLPGFAQYSKVPFLDVKAAVKVNL